MAIVHVNFFSESLVRNVDYLAIIPTDKRTVDGERPRTRADGPLKTLYLLHGIHGCEYDWITGTRIKRWAQERNLAVIMPAGENKFYNDYDPTHDWFGTFIGKELVEATRSMFPLSEKREDTYIAGLSMGGYGSLCAGLRNPERFGAIGAFSAALVGGMYPKDDNCSGVVGRRTHIVSCLGEESSFPGSCNDPYALASRLDASERPRIYMACGKSDFLLNVNREFRDHLQKEGFSLDYCETEGAHEWDFWDTHIYRFLNWLPLDGGRLTEGNVK